MKHLMKKTKTKRPPTLKLTAVPFVGHTFAIVTQYLVRHAF